ncbi:transcriptional regulator [Actinosynnema sp. CS-041913]|uniref:transcriptional regulator n=1 Tax=Actinosynnema sp. CS-041913 TaxID=3239917 RepID=UPI003D939146
MALTIKLRANAFQKASALAGFTSIYGLAKAMEVNRSTLKRVLDGTLSPGAAFIAGAVTALTPFAFDDLFEVVTRTPRQNLDDETDGW